MTGLVVGAFYRFGTKESHFPYRRRNPFQFQIRDWMPFCLICPVSGLGVAGLFKHGGLGLVKYVIVETNQTGLVGDDHTSTDDGADQVR